MSGIIELVRPELRKLRPYRAAHYEPGMLRLNANETPWPPPGDQTQNGLNRYPEVRPATLTRRLARHYGLEPEQLLVTRGSSEAIDCLVRCFCRAGIDEIVITPPTFGMYDFYAQVQGAGVRSVPLLRKRGFAVDTSAIVDGWGEYSKLLFLCSPNNPTGNAIPDEQLQRICDALGSRGLVVVDAAYVEFANHDPTLDLLAAHENVVVLRTLSKALGLAGLRCGAVLGAPAIIDVLSAILPVYSFPTPSQAAALTYLEGDYEALFRKRIHILTGERQRLAAALGSRPWVQRVWPSEANFLLLEVDEPEHVLGTAKAAGIMLRDFSGEANLRGAIRITVGNAEQNDRLLESLC
jgi:histidinol-phosphate aminotransferase